ncbi:MAG: hypothetical protein AAB116_09550 [Candidatus Poribacteria bacterium]
MKNISITISVLIMGSILVCGALAFQKGENQIANGSFEGEPKDELKNATTVNPSNRITLSWGRIKRF